MEKMTERERVQGLLLHTVSMADRFSPQTETVSLGGFAMQPFPLWVTLLFCQVPPCLRFPQFRQVSLIFQDYQTSQSTCVWIVLDSFLTTFSYSQKTLSRVDIKGSGSCYTCDA